MSENYFNTFSTKVIGSYKINRARTQMHALFFPCSDPKPIFIFGCQRSGTTIIQKLINLDSQVKSYGEGDEPYFKDSDGGIGTDLIALDEVKQQLKTEKNNFILLKPLCDSYRAQFILDNFPGSKAVWVYRNFEEVVKSHLSYYDSAHNKFYGEKLRNTQANHWINQEISSKTRKLIDKFQNEELSPASIYALYWLARNDLYSLLKSKDKIIVINYKQLLDRPDEEYKSLCDFLGIKQTKKGSLLINKPMNKPKAKLDIAPEIYAACQEMMSYLETI